MLCIDNSTLFSKILKTFIVIRSYCTVCGLFYNFFCRCFLFNEFLLFLNLLFQIFRNRSYNTVESKLSGKQTEWKANWVESKLSGKQTEWKANWVRKLSGKQTEWKANWVESKLSGKQTEWKANWVESKLSGKQTEAMASVKHLWRFTYKSLVADSRIVTSNPF